MRATSALQGNAGHAANLGAGPLRLETRSARSVFSGASFAALEGRSASPAMGAVGSLYRKCCAAPRVVPVRAVPAAGAVRCPGTAADGTLMPRTLLPADHGPRLPKQRIVCDRSRQQEKQAERLACPPWRHHLTPQPN